MAKAVLVVDDHPMIRKALRRLFASEADFDVCGEAQSGREAIEKAYGLHPDLIIMDLAMPDMNGLDAARYLKAIMPTVHIIMFSEYSEALDETKMRSAGIAASLSKSEQPPTLLAAARSLFVDTAR